MPRRTKLVGREHEQAELEAAVAAVSGGRGGLLLVAGEAGVGKTTSSARQPRSPALDRPCE